MTITMIPTAAPVTVPVADAPGLFKGRWEHGNRQTYKNGCHCEACTAADRDYQQERRDAAAPINARITVTLADTPPPGDWTGRGACARPENKHVNFFPARGEDTKPAKAVCGLCPVRAACREYGLSMPQTLNGIWGGLSGRERRAEQRARRLAAQHELQQQQQPPATKERAA
ncbi:MAG TPA: WhiB family transcriptional regulator [Acidimicrobiales bacterium]|nr:WhiB family transcriptional regulator [Acidimicrobiales bacterium]